MRQEFVLGTSKRRDDLKAIWHTNDVRTVLPYGMVYPSVIDERAAVVKAIATLKAKQAALDLGGIGDYLPGFIIWLEDSVRAFDAQTADKSNLGTTQSLAA